MRAKEAPEYCQLVFNILCVTNLINYYTPSFGFGKKSSVYNQIVIKNIKRRTYGYQTNFLTNIHLKDDLRMEFIV